MPQKFLFTITTGRSGTVFFTELLRTNCMSATVHHERFGFPHFGNTCPDASHLTGFNAVGNEPFVRDFWQRKFSIDQKVRTPTFIEVSHVLSKAGLVENLDLLPDDAEIHLVALRRDLFKILWSYMNRFDFINPGFTWLFTLDSRYKNVIINPEAFKPYNAFGSAYWYILEMFARMEYYRLLVANDSRVVFHEVELETLVTEAGASQFLADFDEPSDSVKMPGKKNETKQEFFGDKEKQIAIDMMNKLQCDPKALGAKFFNSGRRLGAPNLKKKITVKR